MTPLCLSLSHILPLYLFLTHTLKPPLSITDTKTNPPLFLSITQTNSLSLSHSIGIESVYYFSITFASEEQINVTLLSIDDMVLLRPLSVYFFSVRQPLTETQTRIACLALNNSHHTHSLQHSLSFPLLHLGSPAHNALTFSSYSALSLSFSLS